MSQNFRKEVNVNRQTRKQLGRKTERGRRLERERRGREGGGWERERQTDRKSDRQTDRDRKSETDIV